MFGFSTSCWDVLDSKNFYMQDRRPNVPFYEKKEDGSLVVYVELPGVNKKDVGLEFENNVIKVSSKKKLGSQETNSNLSFAVAKDFDLTTAEAEMKDGVLSLEIKPRDSPQRKQIEIR